MNQKWANVQSAYQRRADLIPNLVETVKGYRDYEANTLIQITELRSEAGQAKVSIDSATSPAELQAAMGNMNSVLSRLLVIVENYPDLKANENFLSLQDELAGTENRIKVERDNYNAAVRDYNILARRFPTSIIARWFGFEKKEDIYISSIEKTIFDCTDIIGQLLGFEGDLMRYMSLPEMDIFLKEKKLGEAQLKILEERKEGYVMVYLEEGDQEIIQTGSIVAEIREMLQPSISTTELKGTCAFPGRAKGRVHNLLTDRNWHPPKGAIIVTTMTNPDDTPIIKYESALITEEGGILSHAAVLSRELMIPCIMSTKYATQMLKTGDIIEVDAEKGIIKKV